LIESLKCRNEGAPFFASFAKNGIPRTLSPRDFDPVILARAGTPSLTAPLPAMRISNRWQENKLLLHEWNSVYKSMVAILFPDKDPEEAMTDAMGNPPNSAISL
jgi:hypothetical protein